MQTAHPLTVYLAAPRGFCAGVDRAIERIIDLTGGETPWDGIGSRRVMSNSQAVVQTRRDVE